MMPTLTIEHLAVKRVSSSFLWTFVVKAKPNRIYLISAILACAVQFMIFKLLYPFPDFISDSHSYIATNLFHMKVNLWPIGYSKFLLATHFISHSDTFLVAVQYLLLMSSLLYFFYSILFLYCPGSNAAFALYLFLFFNPIFLYLSNCVLSDALFTTLTIIFLTQFLWMLRTPTKTQALIQGIIIGLAFTIRYTAIFYPLVSITGLLISKQKPFVKAWGGMLGISLMVPFYLYTSFQTKKITGSLQFSVFGGWQIANNALYMYDHIDVNRTTLPPQTTVLNKLASTFFREVPPKNRDLASFPGTYFIKVPNAILKPYMLDRYTWDDAQGQFLAWGKVSPIYETYGKYLISHHLISFARYYLFLNTKNYFLPHLEKFGSYNVGMSTVPSEIQDWFDYITPDVRSVSTNFQGDLFYIYPIIFMILNVFFIGFLIWLLAMKRFSSLSYVFRSSIYLASAYLALNFAFSVFATPVVLRYQIVPFIVLFTFLVLLFDYPKNVHHLK
jgi:hypothetical protein